MLSKSGSVAKLLRANQLRQTPIRQRVLALFLEHREALSQHFLEQKINEADRITLYRTLRTFEEKGLLHRAIDGTDKIKFALCGELCSPEQHQHFHAHFHCDSCGRTLCLENVEAPAAPILPDLSVSSMHLVIRGKCELCGKKKA